MPKEMETGTRTSEPIEILPESIGKIPALEAAPLLARASSRIHTLGWKGEFWNGVRENLEGASAWIKAEKVNLVKKTLSAVTGASLLASMVSCTNGQGPVIIPSETSPRTKEVSPTAPEVTPTATVAATPTETPTPTEVPMAPRPDFESLSDREMAKEIYDYAVLLEEQLHFSQEELETLPFASATHELIKNYGISRNIGAIEWSAELVWVREMSVVDEAGLPIGNVFVGLFGGTGDAPGNRKIFSALLGSSLWGTESELQGGIVVGSRYDLRISYSESWKISSDEKSLNAIIEGIHARIGPDAINPGTVEDLIFGVFSSINLSKISGMTQFYQGLPTDANNMQWPEYISPSR